MGEEKQNKDSHQCQAYDYKNPFVAPFVKGAQPAGRTSTQAFPAKMAQKRLIIMNYAFAMRTGGLHVFFPPTYHNPHPISYCRLMPKRFLK